MWALHAKTGLFDPGYTYTRRSAYQQPLAVQLAAIASIEDMSKLR